MKDKFKNIREELLTYLKGRKSLTHFTTKHNIARRTLTHYMEREGICRHIIHYNQMIKNYNPPWRTPAMTRIFAEIPSLSTYVDKKKRGVKKGPFRKLDLYKDIIIKATEEGMSNRALAKQLNVHPATVSSWKRKYKIENPSIKKNKLDKHKKDILNLLKKGSTIVEIAQKYNVSRIYLARWQVANNITKHKFRCYKWQQSLEVY